jgi:UDP-N-acetylmuramate dehydrogenase
MNMAEQKNLRRGVLRRNEPMSRHTSWRAGGCADRAYVPADLEDMCCFVASLPRHEPIYMVGLGSNLLVRDGGLRGTVIFTHGVLGKTRMEGEAVMAEAGVPCPKLARFAALHERGGAEFMAGIPGTVGGALTMNAGCYGGETWGIVESVTTFDRAGGLHQRAAVDYTIGYRSVILRDGGEEWFAAARFGLPRGDGAKSRAIIKQLLERRIAAQPLNAPNAGSVFRNPPADYAARLIEACGLKGRVRGGAMISDKHANFIVNTGNARAADIENLIETAHDAVKQKFGIDLEREVRIVGEPDEGAQ